MRRQRCDHRWATLGYGFMGHAYLYCLRCGKDKVTSDHIDGVIGAPPQTGASE